MGEVKLPRARLQLIWNLPTVKGVRQYSPITEASEMYIRRFSLTELPQPYGASAAHNVGSMRAFLPAGKAHTRDRRVPHTGLFQPRREDQTLDNGFNLNERPWFVLPVRVKSVR
jgi:hypothetical protein